MSNMASKKNFVTQSNVQAMFRETETKNAHKAYKTNITWQKTMVRNTTY